MEENKEILELESLEELKKLIETMPDGTIASLDIKVVLKNE